MAKSKHFYIRKAHRYLGVILGIQFLMWTLGGLYFSWSNIDEVHGDFERKQVPLLPSNISLVSPAQVLQTIGRIHAADSLVSLQLIEIAGKPMYQVQCVAAMQGSKPEPHRAAMIRLADAQTGMLRGPLSKKEAIEVAAAHFVGYPKLKSVEYLTHTGAHHEYREGALPAYAVQFDHPANAVVYVSTELGTVQKIRNDKWRAFDFLWMLHTMDYEGRDNFGNVLLRIFSIFGLVTVLSGFLLFGISIKRKKRSALIAGNQK